VNVRWWGRWFVLVSLALAPVRAAAGPVEERLADETEELQRFLELRMNRANMPGLAFGLVVDGELVWSFTGGVRDLGTGDPVGADTVFRIGSATKTVTAAAILQLRDAGSIGLDEPVAGQVPELGSVVYPTSDSPPITYRHLLTHTSGLPRVGELDYYTRPDQSVTEAELMAALDAAALEFSPGTRTRYSNLAFGLAGLAVGRASGQPFREVVAERLLAPLQMDSTVWEPEAVPPERLATGYALEEGRRVPVHHWRLGAAEGMGGLYSTLEDMARFVALQLDAWPPRDDPDDGPVCRASLREGHNIGGHASPLGQTFGLGWAVVRDEALGHLVFHTGATYQYACSVFLAPRSGIGVVALTNIGAPEELDGMAKEALERLAQAFPGGVAVQDKALVWGLAQFQRLMQEPTDELIAETFSPVFLTALPPATVKRVFGSLKPAGLCGEPELVRLNGPGWGTFHIPCENDSLELYLVVDSTPPYQVQGLRITTESDGDQVESTTP